jgi:hypothetical protein
MSEIEQQKEVALKVLKKLSVLDPQAILAGGAVRDWYFEKPAKDLDFYVDVTNSNYQQSVAFFKEVLGIEPKDLGSDKVELYSNPRIERVIEGLFEGVRIQIIWVKERQSITDSFPFGICMCAMNARGKLFYSRAFKQEVKHKALVIRNPLYSNKDAYVQKVIGYFPTWKFFKSKDAFLEYLA